MSEEKVVNEEKQVKIKEKLPKKKLIFIIVSCVLSAFLVVFLVAYLLAGNYFFDFALRAKFNQMKEIPKETLDKLEEMPLPDTSREWLEQANITVSEIKSKDDGYKLRALELNQETYSNKWVITIHGYRGTCLDNGRYAKEFFEEGYNVLMPNLEGHGFSEGEFVGMGYTDRLDILGWIDYIVEKDPACQIVLHGVSMGGATVMFVTGEKLPSNVKCAIEDCGYSNVRGIFKHVADVYMDIPFKNTLLGALDFFTKIRMNMHLDDANCVKALKKSTTPTMFIHGDKDNFVPFWMLDVVYNANKNIEKEKLVVSGATHGYSATKDPELYFRKVMEFVNNYIN